MTRVQGSVAWWASPLAVTLLIGLCSLPLLWPSIPPLTDLPGHMGRYAVQTGSGDDTALQRFYGFEWRLIGNLGVDLLMVPLAPVFGVELATKLVVIAIPPLTAWGFVSLSRATDGTIGPAVPFALPLAFGNPFAFGFVNFSLGAALAFLAAALWVRLAERTRLRGVLFAPIAAGVWVCHVSGWGLLGLIAGSAELARRWGDSRSPARAIGGAIAACWPLLLPMVLMVIWRSEAGGGSGDWFNVTQKAQWIAWALRDRWMAFDVASVAVLAMVLWLSLRDHRVRFEPTLLLAAAVVGTVFLLMPRIALGSNFSDMRLAPYLLALPLLAIRASEVRLARRLALLGTLFFVVRLGALTVSYALYDRQADRILAALDHIPRHSRVVALVGAECGHMARPERTYHLPSLAIVRRHAFVNDQWAMAGAQLLKVRYRGASPFVDDPSQIVTPRPCGPWLMTGQALGRLPYNGFDHLWLIDVPRTHWPNNRRLVLRWSDGNAALFSVTR